MSVAIAFVLFGVFLLAFVVSALMVPIVRRVSIRRGWVQRPGGRRLHSQPTSNVGGIAIYAGSMIAIVASLILTRFDPALARSDLELLRVGLVILGGTLIFLVMWRDDVVELPWLPKFIAQIAAALLVVGPFLWDHQRYPDAQGLLTEARGVILTAFNFPIAGGQINLYAISPWLAILATIFWVGWMSNTINWSDGLDGLAAGVSLIASIMLALHAVRLDPPQYTIALLPLALAGACAGFLLFNFPPASIFMGDSGAEYLGFMLGVSAIIGGAKLATVLLVLGVPILDVVWLIVSRTLSGRSATTSGRDHLHLRLRDLGFSQRQIVVFYYGLSASFGLVGVSGASPTFKLVALALLGVIGAGVIGYAATAQRVREPK